MLQQNSTLYLICYSVPLSGEKIVGGCATVAGWGYRHDLGDESSFCRTDFSNLSPSKAT